MNSHIRPGLIRSYPVQACIAFGLFGLFAFAALAPAEGPATRPAGAGSMTLSGETQTITFDGPAEVTFDDKGIHIRSTTAPSTRPTTRPGGGARIIISNNQFGPAAAPVRDRTVNAAEIGQETANPLARLSPEGVALLKKRGVDIEPMQKMKAVLVTGNFCGAASRDIVNADPKLVLVMGKDFKTHGSVRSAGPLIATGEAYFMGKIAGDSLVWFADKSSMNGELSGSPVICSPSTPALYRFKCDELLVGKYGWPE